jgi:hypothetical protein
MPDNSPVFRFPPANPAPTPTPCGDGPPSFAYRPERVDGVRTDIKAMFQWIICQAALARPDAVQWPEGEVPSPETLQRQCREIEANLPPESLEQLSTDPKLAAIHLQAAWHALGWVLGEAESPLLPPAPGGPDHSDRLGH